MTRYAISYPERDGFHIVEDASGTLARIDETLKEEREELLELIDKAKDLEAVALLIKLRIKSDQVKKWQEIARGKYTPVNLVPE